MSNDELTELREWAVYRKANSPIARTVLRLLVDYRLASAVAETLAARRGVEAEILSGKVRDLPQNTPYWNGLMIRERDARVANDSALAAYRSARASVAALQEQKQ